MVNQVMEDLISGGGVFVIVALNVFMIPLFSYVQRIVVISANILRQITSFIMRWLMPVPFCKLQMVSHLKSFFGCATQLRDIELENVTALLATA